MIVRCISVFFCDDAPLHSLETYFFTSLIDPSLTTARDAGRHSDNTLECPIESGLGCVAQARSQFTNVSTLLSQNRQRSVHPPASYVTHDGLAEHLREAVREGRARHRDFRRQRTDRPRATGIVMD